MGHRKNQTASEKQYILTDFENPDVRRHAITIGKQKVSKCIDGKVLALALGTPITIAVGKIVTDKILEHLDWKF